MILDSKDFREMQKRGKGHVSIIFKSCGQYSCPLMSNHLDWNWGDVVWGVGFGDTKEGITHTVGRKHSI